MFPLGYMLYTTKNQLKSIEVIEPLLTKTRKKTMEQQLNLTRDLRRKIQARLDEAAANDPGDASLLCKTLGDISRELGVQQIAAIAGLERTSFYRTFNGLTDARISNVIRVVRALGCSLTIK